MTTSNTPRSSPPDSGKSRLFAFVMVALITAAVVVSIAALLVTIFQRKMEAAHPYVRMVEVDKHTTDPAPWGKNWPRQYDLYLRTSDSTHTRYGGSEALSSDRLERDPWLKRLFAGYAFALDYRDRRGHAYMLSDQLETERMTRPQPGACLHCHASVMPTYERMGNGNIWDGFVKLSAMPYHDAFAELMKTPDGTPEDGTTAHPVSCVDCHDPDSMNLVVTRPGLIKGLEMLAKSADPVPHLPSIERWRKGNRAVAYDPNQDATRQEMRSLVCAQCHVEYYCGPRETLFFPWHNGLKVEQIEKTYENHKFPDGTPFFDWEHAETGAKVFKAQHPEFELWSQGIHARSGVACADCHMPYMREGATKISDHWVRSPLLHVNISCQVCHRVPEAELTARVHTIQDRTRKLIDQSAVALEDMLDAIREAKAAGVPEEQLEPVYALQRKAQWRLDYIYAENSMGFHAPQETARILGESIDLSRQAQAHAIRLWAPAAPATTRPVDQVYGVTPADKAPITPGVTPP